MGNAYRLHHGLDLLILAQAVFTTSSSGFMISRMNYLLEIVEEYKPSTLLS